MPPTPNFMLPSAVIEQFPESLPLTLLRSLNAVNDHGVAVGEGTGGGGRGIAASTAVMADASGITAISPPGSRSSYATDIDETGNVVGVYHDQSGKSHGFFRDALGAFVTLDGPGNSIIGGRGLTMNNQGTVVGTTYGPGPRATLWQPLSPSGGTPIDIHTPPWEASAGLSINGLGTVGGLVASPSSPSLAALYTGGVWVPVSGLTGLGEAYEVFAGPGDLVGVSTRNFGVARCRSGHVTTIQSSTGFFPYAMSNSGAFVGPTSGVGPARWIPASQTHALDLNAVLPPNSGWTLERALAISPNGRWIVGQGRTDDGWIGWFRLHLTWYYQPNTLRKVPREMLPQILFGGRDDEPGVVIGPDGRPRPVPRPGDYLDSLTPGMAEVFGLLASHELLRFGTPANIRRNVQPELIQRAVELLQEVGRLDAADGKPDSSLGERGSPGDSQVE